MRDKLIQDYLKKGEIRIKAINFYLEHEDYPDVIREAQEVVELLLKAVLRYVGIEVPMIHDVGSTIEKYIDHMSEAIKKNIKEIKKISKGLKKRKGNLFLWC